MRPKNIKENIRRLEKHLENENSPPLPLQESSYYPNLPPKLSLETMRLLQ